MKYWNYCERIDSILQARRCTDRTRSIEASWLENQLSLGVSPIVVAIAIESGKAPTKSDAEARKRVSEMQVALEVAESARLRQDPQVLADPKYLLDTGFKIGCPKCGSKNLSNKGKPGSGFGFLGSIPFVVAASIAESVIAGRQKTQLKCNCCNSIFEVDCSIA